MCPTFEFSLPNLFQFASDSRASGSDQKHVRYKLAATIYPGQGNAEIPTYLLLLRKIDARKLLTARPGAD